MRTIPKLTHYMQLQKFVHPSDDFTTTDGEWSDVCDLWANVKTMRAEQRTQNALIDRVITHTVTTRYDYRIPATNETLRLKDITDNDRIYSVKGWVDIDEEHDRIEWEVVEVLA